MLEPSTIPEATLYAYTVLFAAIMIIVLLMTAAVLRRRRIRYRTEKRVQEYFDQWLGDLLLGEINENSHIEIPEELLDRPHNRLAREFAINQLINTKKNLIGQAARNVIQLYRLLGLRKTSWDKFTSPLWYRKARGIYELYMMEQRDTGGAIGKHTNHRNAYVRAEAQTALLAFEGFEGLRFLGGLTQPMNNWQQLKLLEQLHALDPGNFEGLPQWLGSANDSVVIFALKLAEIYQQLQVREEATRCLQHPNSHVREQAVKTLVHIGDEEAGNLLAEQYPTETEHNRKVILEGLEHVATDAQRGFLETTLASDDPAVQLQSARIISRCLKGGEAIIAAKALAQPEPYRQILLHIQSNPAR
ncbi:HEAT repeat domain-containing protein [Chitinophaga caseinilytica]|uniref:HEAT repeat domain-containing protein n=1 Tax=Chitinophaga caseinilytica TaxID=2267521 RepID=UPI003C2AAD8D